MVNLQSSEIINNLLTSAQLITQNSRLVKANQEQFKLLSKRITLVVNKLRYLEYNYLLLPQLITFSEFLTQVQSFIKKFTISSYKYLFLRIVNYQVEFGNLNQQLKQIILSCNLAANQIIEQQEDDWALLIDLKTNQELLTTSRLLLNKLLNNQLNEIFSDLFKDPSRLSVNKFLSYNQLPKNLQQKFVATSWDAIGNQERYSLLQRLELIENSYQALTAEFKAQLAKITLIYRAVFIDEIGNFPELPECWDNNPELHLLWINSDVLAPKPQRYFLFYNELSPDLQSVIAAHNTTKGQTSVANWDKGSNEECYAILQSLATLSEQVWFGPAVRHGSLNLQNYNCLNQQFKEQFQAAIKPILEAVLGLENNQHEVIAEYWHEYAEHHLLWFEYCSSIENIAQSQSSQASALLFSNSSQSTINSCSTSDEAIKLSADPEKVKLLLEVNGFKLLLLKITYEQTTLQYLVGLPTAKADQCLAKGSTVTELDFEEENIVNIFEGDFEISAQELEASKEYFKKFFVADLKFLQSLPNKLRN
jgi:hypothetical protein